MSRDLGFRLDQDGDEPEVSRFNDRFTTYEGRKVRLPSFWLAGERFTLSLTNMAQVVKDASAGASIVRLLAAELEAEASDEQVSAAAMVLQLRCRELSGWKERPKRDVKRRLVPARDRGRYR